MLEGDVLVLKQNILFQVVDFDIVGQRLVPNHEDVEIIIAQHIQNFFLMIQVNTGRVRRHVHMRVPLHMDILKTLVIGVIHQPLGILLCIHFHRGTANSLRIDHNIRNDILVFTLILSTACHTMPCDLLIEVTNQGRHFRPCIGREIQYRFTVCDGKCFGERELTVGQLGKL